MRLEYIASALSFILLSQFEKLKTPESVATIRDMVKRANSWYPYHDFGVLFNGYNEPADGPFHTEYFSPYNIQVDSGGLQMITLGHTPTDIMREKVYRVQAKYGTVAMCFDEIPLRITGKSQAVDVTGGSRKFDRGMIDDCTKQTAINIIKQIDIFREVGTTCKPYLIIQGNGLETYQEWADKILKYIPDDYQKELGGIASGGACIGDGELEDIERFFTLATLDAPEHLLNNFHLLGVGSPNRIQSLIKIEHLFKDYQKVSYDSTKHTGGLVRSQIQIGSQIIMIGRHRTQTYWKIWHLFDTFQKTKLGLSFTEEQFHDAIMTTVGDLVNKYGELNESNVEVVNNVNVLRFALMFFSVYNLFEHIDKLKTDKYHTSNAKKKNVPIYSALQQVNSKEDFYKWKRECGRFLNSRKTPVVGDEGISLLEGLF